MKLTGRLAALARASRAQYRRISAAKAPARSLFAIRYAALKADD
jgi:hypothetical protein